MTLNLEENVSCKNLILFQTKLLRRQRLLSDARLHVRLYSRIKDRKSPIKGSRPSVPHGTNFYRCSPSSCAAAVWDMVTFCYHRVTWKLAFNCLFCCFSNVVTTATFGILMLKSSTLVQLHLPMKHILLSLVPDSTVLRKLF